MHSETKPVQKECHIIMSWICYSHLYFAVRSRRLSGLSSQLLTGALTRRYSQNRRQISIKSEGVPLTDDAAQNSNDSPSSASSLLPKKSFFQRLGRRSESRKGPPATESLLRSKSRASGFEKLLGPQSSNKVRFV